MTLLEVKGLTPAPAATPRSTVKLADEGIVVAIVAVTGVVDAVADLIVPGAFSASLKVRRPKVVDDHEWKHKVGRVLHIEEWLPGDTRLPKTTKEGNPWPAAAGALVATMQYNLATQRGRDSFAMVKFYAETNEAEFSIGYKAVEGKVRKRTDGVRVILMVDLWELSHVLFGAAPLSMALEVKSMHAGAAGAVQVPATGAPDDTNDDEFPAVKVPNPNVPWDTDTAPMEAKTAASVLLRAKTAGGADKNRGTAENLRHWFVAGGDGAIAWGSPGDFDRCVGIAGKHMTPDQAKGYCNLRHHDALGFYPATHAAMEGKSMSDKMKGSFEERVSLLEEAAEDLMEAMLPVKVHYVWVVATYATEVVVRVGTEGKDSNYLIPYEVDGEGRVGLGTPQRVEVSLTLEPADDASEEAAEPPEEEAAEEPTDGSLPRLDRMMVDARFAPVTAMLAMEGKTGDYARKVLAEALQGKSSMSEPGDDEDYKSAQPDDLVDGDGDGAATGVDGDADDQVVDPAEPANDLPPEPTEPAEAEAEAEAEAPAADHVTEPTDLPADEERVTINPDDHFALMQSLDDAAHTPNPDEDPTLKA